MLVIISGVLCMKFFARADNTYHDEVLNYSLREDGTAAVTGLYNISATVINIPDKIHPNEDAQENTEYSVTEISQNAFSGSNITEVHGQLIKTIGYNSFKSCKTLTTVDFQSAIYIGDSSFYDCSILKNIDISNAIYIGDKAFNGCYGINNLNVQNAIHIGDRAFFSCYGINKLNVQNATYIGNKAFYNCSALAIVSLPNATYIGNNSFDACYILGNINLTNTTYIANQAFKDCRYLTNIETPNLIYLDASAFNNFPNVSNCTLTVPKNMKEFNWNNLDNVPNINYTDKNAPIALTIHESDNINTELDKLKNNLSNEFFGESGKIVYDFQAERNYPIKSGSNSKYYAIEFMPVEETTDSLTKFPKRFSLIKILSNLNIGLFDDDDTPFESTKYTGDEIEKPIVKITDGSYTLSEGVDYNLTYDTDFINAGEKNILVDFMGDYSELRSIVKKFKILPIDASELTVPDIEFDYTGESHNLDSLKITYDAPKFITLEKGEDYDFINNPDTKNAGEKKLYISFKNNYSGTREVDIKINPKDASNFEVKYDKTHFYDGKDWEPQFKITDVDNELILGKDYEIKLDEDMKNVGVKNVKIKYLGNYSGTKKVQLEIIVDKSNWGKEIINNGVVNYVDDYGKTSAEVTGNEIIWLKESSDGSSAWYAVDNSKGVFRKGSRFWVKWLSPKSDKEEFDKYYSQLDESQKNKVEENKLWIFLTGVTDPDGNDYSTLNTPIDYHIQIGQDWDKEDINAVFISEGKDDTLGVSYKKIKFPEGNDEFAKLSLIHFSPYAIFDELDDTPAQKNEISNYPTNEENSHDSYLDKNQFIRSIINYNVDSGLISKISTWIFLILVSFFAFTNLKKSKKSK